MSNPDTLSAPAASRRASSGSTSGPESLTPPAIPDDTPTAPGGIIDRRKSQRQLKLSPGSRRGQSGPRKKSLSPRFPIRVSMADEDPKRDDTETPGDEKEQTFEDAQDTTSTPAQGETANTINGHLSPPSDQHRPADEQSIDGTEQDGGLGIVLNGNGNGNVSDASNGGEEDASDKPMSFRISTVGGHDIDFGGDGTATEPSHSRQATLESAPSLPPKAPPRDMERSVSPKRMPKRSPSPMKGLSGNLPAVNYPPPPSAPERTSPMPSPSAEGPPGMARKASSPFGFLSRMTSIRRSAKSPPGDRQPSKFAERRNTAASMASVASTGTSNDGSLATISDGPGDGASSETKQAKASLKDQFQLLRMQQENSAVPGQMEEENTEDVDTPTGGHGLACPTRENDAFQATRAASTSGLLKSPPTNPRLPPGTAAGMTAGPSEEPAPVNWDLWQSVVYEGPAAVARTSGEELNQAIASGIPAAIRGVVWQVLAQSKNEELEEVYRDLVGRGADKEQRPNGITRTDSSAGNVNGLHEKESLASSASSIHSNSSTPATSAMASSPPSVDGTGADTAAKLQSSLSAERTKRIKDDKEAIQKLEKVIKRDMGARTSYSKYVMSAGLQEGLFGVCKAYALFDEGVGYAQGINFLAMPLLFNMSEEEAFTLLVRLMSKYDLRSLFTLEMTGLHLHLYQFERLLEDFEPALYCHLHRRGVSPTLYATQWFLTLFAYRFPLQLVLRIYDLILSRGLSAILKFGIVLMQKNAQTLLQMKDMSELTTYLKEKLFDVYIDKSPSESRLLDSGFFGSASGGADREVYRADEMVRDACAVDITAETLARYTAEWEETQRLEKEREIELINLRTMNATLSVKVKELEERTQQHDTEHVGIASELVRTKVENEALLDANEGLKLQVQELQKMVDAQPAEVEAQLKEEMDRILQRNSEVQNQNRALEEQLEEMEQELVGTKMIHAQTQSDHDALKQKMANIQAMFNEK